MPKQTPEQRVRNRREMVAEMARGFAWVREHPDDGPAHEEIDAIEDLAFMLGLDSPAMRDEAATAAADVPAPSSWPR